MPVNPSLTRRWACQRAQHDCKETRASSSKAPAATSLQGGFEEAAAGAPARLRRSTTWRASSGLPGAGYVYCEAPPDPFILTMLRNACGALQDCMGKSMGLQRHIVQAAQAT